MSTHPTTNNTPAEAEPLAVRPREAARMLGISERKLWELTADQSSGIPHTRFGRAVVYPVDLLREWLSEQAAKGGRK